MGASRECDGNFRARPDRNRLDRQRNRDCNHNGFLAGRTNQLRAKAFAYVLSVTNKTNEAIVFETTDVAVNGYYDDNFTTRSFISAYETTTNYIVGLFYRLECIAESFDDVYLVTGHLSVWKESEGPYDVQVIDVTGTSQTSDVSSGRGDVNFIFYPQGDTAETVKILERTPADTEIQFAANKYFTASFRGFMDYGWMGVIYFENNTDDTLFIEFTNISINGETCNNDGIFMMPPRTRSLNNIIYLTLPDEIDAKDIETIKFDMTVSEYYSRDIVGGFSAKTITIKNPAVLESE